MILRFFVLALALFSVFALPWHITLGTLFAAGIAFPPAGLLIGVFTDTLYWTPGASFMPYFTFAGALSFGIGLLVHRFIKTRIMDA